MGRTERSGIDVDIVPSELLHALTRSIEEEAKPMLALVVDEDSDCITRDLRAARLEGLEWCLRLLRAAERWEWMASDSAVYRAEIRETDQGLVLARRSGCAERASVVR